MSPTNGLEGKAVSLTRATRKRVTDSCIDALREAILDGSFPPGSQLPTEKSLVESFGVSRSTVREALEALEQVGLITRRQGLGTFVSTEPITKDLNVNAGIGAMLRDAGYSTHVGELTVWQSRASSAEAAALALQQEDEVVRVERLRLIDSRPVVWSIDALPTSVVTDRLLRQELGKTGSLYDLLLKEHEVRVVRGAATLRSINATHEMAKKLAVDAGQALMLLEQTDFDATGRAVLYSLEYHLSDFFEFHVQRAGPYR